MAMSRLVFAVLTAFLAAATLPAQPLSPAAQAQAKQEEIEQGLPVTNDAVRKSCSPCHKVDDKQRMTRISYRRTTPEGWEFTLKRMISLNKLTIDPATAREVIKYLANNHGLAPEEAKPAAFEVEHTLIEYRYTADKDAETVCIKCHSFGRVLSQRRTKTDWEMLVAMHRGYYPLSDFQAFRNMGSRSAMAREAAASATPGAPVDPRPPDTRQPMEKAIAHLSTAFPLRTPEWSAWSANMRPPKLAGRWAVSGMQPGKGPIYGQVTITPKPGMEDEFTTQIEYVFARTGQTVKATGRAVVYTGFQWRGRHGENNAMREVLFIDPNQREAEGRWFTGEYEETGMDVKLKRIGNDPVLLGLDHTALKTGANGQAVAIHGVNLPADLSASAIDFGRGVTVTRVVSATPNLAKLEVDVAPTAALGRRDVFVAGTSLAAAAVVYDKVDGIKVLPRAGMARVGGLNFPKQFQQFEAFAFSNGPDGKPDTKDDLELGPVNVAWSVEEYTAVYNDDDREYVGKIDDNGLFTPNVDGPNPKRRNSANNVGDVWVVAAYATDGKVIRGRAHLLVTVPLYTRFDTIEAPTQ